MAGGLSSPSTLYIHDPLSVLVPFSPASLWLPLSRSLFLRLSLSHSRARGTLAHSSSPRRLDNDSVAVDPPRCELCSGTCVLRAATFLRPFLLLPPSHLPPPLYRLLFNYPSSFHHAPLLCSLSSVSLIPLPSFFQCHHTATVELSFFKITQLDKRAIEISCQERKQTCVSRSLFCIFLHERENKGEKRNSWKRVGGRRRKQGEIEREKERDRLRKGETREKEGGGRREGERERHECFRALAKSTLGVEAPGAELAPACAGQRSGSFQFLTSPLAMSPGGSRRLRADKRTR